MTRTTFTSITPLPPNIPRQVVIDFLHDHLEMIDLNPLIKERHQIPPPEHAPTEEKRCVWYSLTDRIDYLPGGVVSGQVSYTCAFYDLPEGLQTHCYAPMGLDIRDRWSVGGSLPGEPPEPIELGLGAPMTGLYLREDVDLRCNMLMAGFVKKTLKKSHGSLVDKLAAKAQIVSANQSTQEFRSNSPGSFQTPTPTGSESSGMPPFGPLLPPGSGPEQRPMVPAHSPYNGHSPSSSLGDFQQHRNGGLVPPLQPQRLGSDHSGLGYSGTVYRGNSKPQDYTEFSVQNPYDNSHSQQDDQRHSDVDGTARGYPYHQYEKL
ncbi:hypothetical protein FALBO_2120 [Fusarium albosuccineum]|uniref:DUF7053 domain-containing protein n=1 Tax=Fusarium albosuccineum TaxID=1237068 RepID=A0A8H4LKN3_9HYPO|nr:hypothetical protein FALBO_2120 [Fusarium albosuccineum]KAF5008905.1 hypothetical protein FDECE_4837 [Fusarium decemcellulare]